MSCVSSMYYPKKSYKLKIESCKRQIIQTSASEEIKDAKWEFTDNKGELPIFAASTGRYEDYLKNFASAECEVKDSK